MNHYAWTYKSATNWQELKLKVPLQAIYFLIAHYVVSWKFL